MSDLQHYVIRGGIEGRERLKVLSRVMQATTSLLFERVGITEGMTCLDVGCGSGAVTLELARRVGPCGRVVGADLDQTKVDLAGQEAEALGISNAEFCVLDIRDCPARYQVDVVYARFLLTHLQNPERLIKTFRQCLRPGGMVIIEDIDFSGYFVFPSSRAFERFHDLYSRAVQKRGGDPNMGLRVPLMLKEEGFAEVEMAIVQPAGMAGEAKLLNPLTMENISQAVIEEGLATGEEVAEIIQELYAYAADDKTIAGAPRVIQAWGRRPE
jgi:ubiquinone/menaquinone biosynthesis C-methylase UbiE